MPSPEADVLPAWRWFFRLAAGLALIAGFLLFPLATETDRFFSWTIGPPITAAFLGAAYWAAFVLLAWSAAQTSWRRAGAAVLPVLTIAALLLVVTLIHLDKFDLDSVFGWFWLFVYVCVTPLLLYLVWLQGRPSTAAGERGVHVVVRAVLSLQGALLLAVGAALLIAPVDASDLWPWTLTPLTARAIGAFLVGFGVAAAYSVRLDDLAALRGCAYSYTVLGALEIVAPAIHGGDLTGTAAHCSAYFAFWASVLAVGLYGVAAPDASSNARTADSWSR